MTHLTRSIALFLSLLLLSSTAQATVIFDWATVGNPGNANDVVHGGNPAAGAVSTTYRIAKHEVTNTQYTEFLNAKAATNGDVLALYNTSMSSNARGGITRTGSGTGGDPYIYTVKPGQGNNPVVLVSFYDTLRFSNWMHNLQAVGDTETGAYTLLGGTPTPSNGTTVLRNLGATVFLTSENEWYKAAYHDPVNAVADASGTTDYWLHAMKTDSDPYSDQVPGTSSPDATKAGNFYKDAGGDVGFNDGYAVTGSTSFVGVTNYLTDVGAYTTATSPYGTFDQGGNVWEWNEAIISVSLRGLRGGSWYNSTSNLAASYRFRYSPTGEDITIGFRVASPFSEPALVPEPETVVLGVIGGLLLMVFAGRRFQTDSRQIARSRYLAGADG